jgi:hypothetical protein
VSDEADRIGDVFARLGLGDWPRSASAPPQTGRLQDSIKLGDTVRVIGVPGIPEDSVYAVDLASSRIDQGCDIRDFKLDATPNVTPGCLTHGCGRPAWVEGRCARCFREHKRVGPEEFILKKPGGHWVVAATHPELEPGEEIAAAGGKLWGKTNDGMRWIEGYSSGQRWWAEVRDRAPAAPRRPPPLEERVALLSDEDRERLERAARMVLNLRKLEAEAKAIRDDQVPEIPHEVLGFREWRFDANSWQLEAAGGMGHGAWQPGANRAECGSTGIPAPCDVEGHHCGFNVYARVKEIGAHFYTGAQSTVAGAVRAWSDEGRFYVHEGVGFRAEYAEVVVLAVDERHPRAKRSAVRGIAEDFGVPTCDLRDLETAASEFGEFCPDDVLAWSRGEGPMPGVDPEVARTYERISEEVLSLRRQVASYCAAIAGEHLTRDEVDRLVGLVDLVYR